MSHTAIRNYLAIAENLHTSGLPTPEQFAWIRAAGCAVVVNLLPDNGQYATDDEEDTVREHGMEYIHIPVIWQNPTLNDLRRFFAVMEENSDRSVWVHCAVNMRVSTFVYLYRTLHLGVSEAAAVRDLHRIWKPEGWWADFVDEARTAFAADSAVSSK
jgi:protein tyrosine phosphatase (PTP) superfamily phosphohydrolase (DUF442 family)